MEKEEIGGSERGFEKEWEEWGGWGVGGVRVELVKGEEELGGKEEEDREGSGGEGGGEEVRKNENGVMD